MGSPPVAMMDVCMGITKSSTILQQQAGESIDGDLFDIVDKEDSGLINKRRDGARKLTIHY